MSLNKIRGFEAVSLIRRQTTDQFILPHRKTQQAAGYDIATPLTVTIPAKQSQLIWTNIKAYMQSHEVLLIYIRSSIGIQKGLILANGTGIIDADYYNNISNEGNIGICLFNTTDQAVSLIAGERIAQGIFMPYLIADQGNEGNIRVGGIGSSD
jgi:dUTP pyrophosphatase